LEPSRNRVVVPARQATQPGGIGSLKSILGLLKSLKIQAFISNGGMFKLALAERDKNQTMIDFRGKKERKKERKNLDKLV
jgi:hypothetical protein